MNTTTIVLLVLGCAALVAAVLMFRRRGLTSRRQPQVAAAAVLQGGTSLVEAAQEEPAPLPPAIHFGTDPISPAITLRPLPLSELTAVAKIPVIQPSLGVASRISALMQATPSLLVAEAHRGRQLMEVVIDGKLIRAADGDGFRAMTKGSSGIKEHARLYDTKDLRNLVNAAAVWQLASVIVAQKHMADINQKLSEIKDGVTSISEFIDNERRAVIHGTYQYLRQAYEALEQGELSLAIRGELESCERELLAVQNHLVDDIRRRALVAPRDDDMFGTESLHKTGVAKYRELGQTADDLKLCLRTRALSWYVLSLYPGEQALKAVRCESIKQGLAELESVQSLVISRSRSDVEGFKSIWNHDKTLEVRKGEILGEARNVQGQLEVARVDTFAQLERTQTLLLERDSPTQLIVEIFDGVVKNVRQRELAAA